MTLSWDQGHYVWKGAVPLYGLALTTTGVVLLYCDTWKGPQTSRPDPDTQWDLLTCA